MTAQKHFNGKAFLQKIKKEGLTEYLSHTRHPKKLFIDEILQQEHEPYHRICQLVMDFINSSDNPNHSTDMTFLPMINDLASSKGRLIIQQLTNERSLTIELLPELTDHQLAMTLFIHDEKSFREAHALLCIDYVEGWVNYAGKDLSALVENIQTAGAEFTNKIKQYLVKQRIGYQVDCHVYQNRGRVIIDLFNDGPLKREITFNENNEVSAISKACIYEHVLAYYENTGHLKVRTPRGQDDLNRFLYEEFSHCFLKQPNALLNLRSSQTVFLNELLSRDSFPVDPATGLKEAKITSLVIFPFPGSPGRITLYHKDGEIQDMLSRYNIKPDRAKVVQADIQFVFEGKGRGTTRTACLWHKGNKDNLNTTYRDEMILDQLKKWGLISA